MTTIGATALSVEEIVWMVTAAWAKDQPAAEPESAFVSAFQGSIYEV